MYANHDPAKRLSSPGHRGSRARHADCRRARLTLPSRGAYLALHLWGLGACMVRRRDRRSPGTRLPPLARGSTLLVCRAWAAGHRPHTRRVPGHQETVWTSRRLGQTPDTPERHHAVARRRRAPRPFAGNGPTVPCSLIPIYRRLVLGSLRGGPHGSDRRRFSPCVRCTAYPRDSVRALLLDHHLLALPGRASNLRSRIRWGRMCHRGVSAVAPWRGQRNRLHRTRCWVRDSRTAQVFAAPCGTAAWDE